MAAEITNAGDLIDSTATYATAADVEVLLTGILTDVAGTALAQVLTSAERQVILSKYLDFARDEIHRRSGRDFTAHEDVTVTVSGSGTSVLNLHSLGFVPLVSISEVAWATWSGREELSDASAIRYTRGGLLVFDGGTFPRGDFNVYLVLSYGFKDGNPSWQPVPSDVKRAQALLAAAHVLEYIQAAKQADGVGGVEVIQYGDMQIRHYERGRFTKTIEAWKNEAYAVCSFYRGVSIGYWDAAQSDEYGERIAAR